MIDEIGGKRGRGIQQSIRDRVHEVRRVRNYWAHEEEDAPALLTVEEARSRLHRFINELPDEWD